MWRVSGNARAEESGIPYSGVRENAGPGWIKYSRPVESLRQGNYQLMALMTTTATTPDYYDIDVQMQAATPGGVILDDDARLAAYGTGFREYLVPGEYHIYGLGQYSLPLVAAKTGSVVINIRTPSSANAQLIEAWLFRMDDDCALSVVYTKEPHLWLDAPGVDNGLVESIRVGARSDRADEYYPAGGVRSMGQHVARPEGLATLVATSETAWPDVTYTYFERGHSTAPFRED